MGIVFLYVFLVGGPDSLSIQLLLLTVVRLVEVLKEDLRMYQKVASNNLLVTIANRLTVANN